MAKNDSIKKMIVLCFVPVLYTAADVDSILGTPMWFPVILE